MAAIDATPRGRKADADGCQITVTCDGGAITMDARAYPDDHARHPRDRGAPQVRAAAAAEGRTLGPPDFIGCCSEQRDPCASRRR
jgi:hypothetical protein